MDKIWDSGSYDRRSIRLGGTNNEISHFVHDALFGGGIMHNYRRYNML